MRPFSTALLLALGTSLPAAAQQSGQSDTDEPITAPREAIAVPTDDPPVIDGRLDEAVWGPAEPLTGFVQREPLEGRPGSERTEVRILFDDHAIYVGAWLHDREPEGIVFGETRRDASLNDNDAFLIVFDTYLDRQNGFVFGTTPAGIEYDGQVSNQGEGGGGGGRGRQQASSGAGFNLNWDGSWEVATSRDGSGWYAEFRIPFSTLRYPREGEQSWGLNFARNIRRKNEELVWAPVPRQFNLYRVSLAGTLSGLQAPSRRTLTVTPYTLGATLKDYTVPAPELDANAELGADAKVGLTQSLTLDLTVNTDFAQAEVDDQQVNLTRFPLFFPEKRAFFLENAGTFAVGSGRTAELFFSRRVGLTGGRVVPIQGGSRLTGRLGGVQIGLLNIQTDHLDVFDPTLGTDVRVAPANNSGVVRAFKELGNRTRLGGIFVSRLNTDQTSDYNLTWGVDGALGIGQALTFTGWAAQTSTPGVGDGEYGFDFGGTYDTRDWQISSEYRQIGAEFNPELGFVNRRAYRFVSARVLRHVRTPSISWMRELRPHISWQEHWDLGGFTETRLVHIDNHFAFANGAFFQLPGFNITAEGLKEDFEIRPGIVIPAGTYDNLDWEFRFNTDRSAPLSISGGWAAGGFYNGTRIGPNATLTYRVQDRFVASLSESYFDVRLDQGRFTSSVTALRGVYSFTPRFYVQATVQYADDLLRSTRDLGTNLQLGWLDTAGTGLYVVYNDAEHLGSMTRTGIARGPTARQLIIKYTRLFDLSR